MLHRLSPIAVLLALAACSSSSTITSVDSCSSQTGTCVDVQIHDASPSLGTIDSLEVSLTGAITRRGAVQFPSGIAALPASIALLLPDAGGAVTVTVGAVRAGHLVGLGSGQITATAGQHSTTTITLAAACASGACETGAHCVLDADCATNHCDPASLTCVPATSSAVPSAATSIISAPANAAPGVAFQVSLQAKDAAGTSLTSGGATVLFTSANGGASFGTVADNGNGTYSASATAPSAGSVTIGATLNGATVTSTATVAVRVSSAATHLALTAQSQQTSRAAFAVTVNALDASNNAATSYAGTLHFTSSDSSAQLPADTAFPSGSGTTTIQGITLVTTGTQTLTIADASNASISGSISITVVAAVTNPVVHYALTAASQVTSGASVPVKVSALDASNNTAAGYSGTMHFTSSDSAAVLPADSTLSGSSETATLSVQLVTAGAQTVTVTDASNSAISSSVSITVLAPPAACVISAPGTAAPNSTVVASVTAVSGLTYQWSIAGATFAGGGTSASGVSVTISMGTAAATLTCIASNAAGATSAPAQKSIGIATPVVHYKLTAPAQVTSGGTFAVQVAALDASNNAAAGYSGTMHVASSDSAAILPADSVLSGSSETASVSVQLVTAGNQTVTVTDASNGSISGSVSINVLAAATPCQFTVPDSVLPNGSGTATVTAVGGLTYSWAITNATFSSPNSGTVASGTSVSFTAGTASPITLTCVASNSAGTQAPSVSKNIPVVAPATLSIVIVGQDPAYSPDAGTVQAGDAPVTLSTFQGASTPVAASWASVSVGTLTSADAGTINSADSVQYNSPANISAQATQAITATAGSNSATATLTVVPYGTWSNWTMPPDSPTNYTDKGNGTVLDNTTGLLWQQQLSSATFSWGNATLYCKGLMLGGLSGWRLPSVLELISLVNYGAQPAVNSTYFPSAPSYYHWTATPSTANAGYYWVVEFADGSTAQGDPSTSYDVRCVH